MSARVVVPKTASTSATRSRLKPKAAIEITESAANRLKFLLSKKDDALGIRVGLKKRGCNGLSYTMDYALQKKSTDELVQQHGVSVFIDPQALLSIIGTKMDYLKDDMKEEFVFTNPNATGSCGCGESFSLD